MVIGATILAVTAFTEINGEDQNGNQEGGWDSLWAKYECAYAGDFKNSSETITGRVSVITSTGTVRRWYGPVNFWEPRKGAQCGGIRDDYDSIFRDPVDSDLPWPGMIFGLTVISTWYWCTDQARAQKLMKQYDLDDLKIPFTR